MEKKDRKGRKCVKKDEAVLRNEEHLGELFSMLKKMAGITFKNERSHFNNSEMRLLGEVVLAEYEGRRVISTQLADRLGVTRSAVSQMVNKLEERGTVKRVADEVDRKIAYIELSPKAHAYYEEEKALYCEFVEKLIEKFGKENFDKLIELTDEFISAVDAVKTYED